MNRLFLMRNPYVFQGEKYINKNKNYFEGWYFKNTNKEDTICFIPGINLEDGNKKAFIQVITNDSSYFVNYHINDFDFEYSPFNVKIGNNFFSKDIVNIDIRDDIQNLKIYGSLKYSNNKNIKTNFLKPNIMGPFSYIPFMECNHGILSMKNNIEGLININNKIIEFKDGLRIYRKRLGIFFS